MEKRLYRDEYRKKIGGVCAGLAEYFDIDVAVIRAMFLLTFIFMGTGLMAYVVLWIVLPKKGPAYFNPGVDYRMNPQQPYSPFDNAGPAQSAPFEPVQGTPYNFNAPKKSASTVGVIVGMFLIFFGAVFLLHELHLIFFWHIAKLWPAILVVGGIAIIVSGQKKQPWEKDNWQNNATVEPEVKATDEAPLKEEPKDDNFNNPTSTI